MSRHRAQRATIGRVGFELLAESGDAEGGARKRGDRPRGQRRRRVCDEQPLPPKPNTAPVQRTSITSGVSATGSLTAITEQNIGFTKGGQLTAVNVKVGDRVTAGQVLATVDPFAAQQVARPGPRPADHAAGHAQQGLRTPPRSPTRAGHPSTRPRRSSQKTRDQADAVQDADETAIDNAKPPAQPGQEGARQGPGPAEAKAPARPDP